MAAIAGYEVQVEDFDSQPGLPLPSGSLLGGGITLTYSLGGVPAPQALVDDRFDTVSGSHYLGLDAADGAFLSGDALQFNFDRPRHAFGLFVIASPADLQAGDISLGAGLASVGNGVDAWAVLPDGGEAYFLGIAGEWADAFTSATLASHDPAGLGLFLWTADSLTVASLPTPVSVPDSLPLLLAGWRAGAGRNVQGRLPPLNTT